MNTGKPVGNASDGPGRITPPVVGVMGVLLWLGLRALIRPSGLPPSIFIPKRPTRWRMDDGVDGN